LELVLHALPFVGVGRSRLALDNGLPHLGKLGIEPGEVLLVVGDIVLREDRLHGTFGDAQRAVDALVRIDHEEVRPFAEAVDRAYVDAVGVLALDAAFGDDVGHVRDPGKRVDFSKAAPQLAASACTSAGVGLPYFCTRRPVRGAVRSGAPASRNPRGVRGAQSSSTLPTPRAQKSSMYPTPRSTGTSCNRRRPSWSTTGPNGAVPAR